MEVEDSQAPEEQLFVMLAAAPEVPPALPEAVSEQEAEEAVVGEAGPAEADPEPMTWFWGINWQKQCSKHLSHIADRLTQGEFLGHEVVRQLMQIIEGFSPEPRGGYGWLMRKASDYSVRCLRLLVITYGKDEVSEEFMRKAVTLVRLYFEEAFHRCLLHREDLASRAALSSLMVTLHHAEAATLGEDHLRMGICRTFAEDNMTFLGTLVLRGESSVRRLPSFGEATSTGPMSVEVHSLVPLKMRDVTNVMPRAEVKCLIEHQGQRVEVAELQHLPDGHSRIMREYMRVQASIDVGLLRGGIP